MAQPLTGRQLARRTDDGRVDVRPEPLRCRLRLDGLHAADAHTVDVTFSCSVQALPARPERQMLAETFLAGRDAVTADEVLEHFAPALARRAADVVDKQPAEHWLTDGAKPMVVEALRDAAKPVAFACGVELLPPFELSVESATLQREKLESMQRQLAERRAAGQLEHVQRAAELLKQFQALRESMPELSPGQLLERVSADDRGSMLQSLLLASASGGGGTHGSAGAGAAMLWAVAGTNLLKLDPRQDPPRPQLVELPSDLGPFRSVRAAELAGRRGLLVGARDGVMWVDPEDPREARKFRDAGVTSAFGFNSAAAVTDHAVTDDAATIWASHSDAGVVAWRADQPDAPPAKVLRLEGLDPRHLVALDARRVLYASGGEAFVVALDSEPAPLPAQGREPIVFIGLDASHVVLVRADGLVERLDRDTLQPAGSPERRCGEVTSAGLLPWLGGAHRLLLATADGPVCCAGADDPLLTQYLSPHRGLRAVTACADTVAAVSGDRQRLVLWRSWDGTRPAAELHVASLARHRAADVCFG